MRMEENCGAGIHLPPTDYIHTDIEGKHVIYTTLRQTAKHTVGLDRCCHNGRLYTRHGKKYFRPYRNFFAGKNRELDMLVEAGFMEYSADVPFQGCPSREMRTYRFNRLGLDWLGAELGMYIYDVES